VVLLKQHEPLRRVVASHVEGGQEHLPGILVGLNGKKLWAPIEPMDRPYHRTEVNNNLWWWRAMLVVGRSALVIISGEVCRIEGGWVPLAGPGCL
jgi:hypothetical protein